MKVIFEEKIEIMGEPGPNLLFKGRPDEFLHMVNSLHKLGCENGHSIMLSMQYLDIELLNLKSLTLQSSNNGNILLSSKNGHFCMNLDKRFWVSDLAT